MERLLNTILPKTEVVVTEEGKAKGQEVKVTMGNDQVEKVLVGKDPEETTKDPAGINRRSGIYFLFQGILPGLFSNFS